MNKCPHFRCRISATCIMYPDSCNKCVLGDDCHMCMIRYNYHCPVGIVDIKAEKIKNRRKNPTVNNK